MIAAAERDGRRGVRWVGEDAFHLTLRFLGETPTDRVAAAAEAVAEATRASRPFAVTLGRSGAFPRAAAPRTLWLGIEEGGDALADLATSVEHALVVRGWPADDRPFRAHLTLGRCEDPLAGSRVAEALSAASARFHATWRVGTLVLYESHLGRGPARYAVVAEHPLGG
jgi:RNA 2',3'-cyclic 3'-phosphodiesterase